jgi:hypothetical protein
VQVSAGLGSYQRFPSPYSISKFLAVPAAPKGCAMVFYFMYCGDTESLGPGEDPW